ncbi:MAG TPA: hypothetical protein VLG28_07555 [Acidimicrobiia bacterium]|jgi:hypothetical protein|nr:hypothetical protein [Acidimicrobiia bacterium]
MRILFVSLLAGSLLVATVPLALAQESGADPTGRSVEQSEEPGSARGNTDWIRTVGILGIVGVWGIRGVNSVRRSRREREQWSAEAVRDETVRDETGAPPTVVPGAAEGAS